jgi:lipopolysaccharide biosynthesis protein
MRELPANDSVALHLHVFYPDLLPDIMSRLSCNRSRPDLLVSVASAEARDVVARCLESYEGKVAALEVVPNRGRDIGPFLTQFGRRIVSEYAYVGHIHTKKTEAAKDATVGKAWFEFLMAHLLGGSSGAMADAVLASMNADGSLGIVFPEDPNALGWGTNRRFAEQLASKTGITKLPQHFNFPVGSMFWARTCALSPLIDMNLQWEDYPREPLPHDGTLLHAIERLLPLTLRAGTQRVAVTNVIGVTR